MKTLYITFIGFISFLASAQAQSGATTATSSAEAAIKKAIADETTAFFSKNKEQWSNAWVHESYVSWSANGAPGKILTQCGWESYSSMFADYFTSPQTAPAPTFQRENFQVGVLDKIATVTFLQTRTLADGSASKSREIRVLEKQGNDWKLSYVHSRIID